MKTSSLREVITHRVLCSWMAGATVSFFGHDDSLGEMVRFRLDERGP
jgi:hypothetical protein